MTMVSAHTTVISQLVWFVAGGQVAVEQTDAKQQQHVGHCDRRDVPVREWLCVCQETPGKRFTPCISQALVDEALP